MRSKSVVIAIGCFVLGWGLLELLSPMAICDGWVDVNVFSRMACSEHFPKRRVALIHSRFINTDFDPTQWFEDFQCKDLPCGGNDPAALKTGFSFRAGGFLIPRRWGYVVEYDTVVIFGSGQPTQLIPFTRRMGQPSVTVFVDDHPDDQ
jgi:hypothetical protein